MEDPNSAEAKTRTADDFLRVGAGEKLNKMEQAQPSHVALAVALALALAVAVAVAQA